MNRRLRRTVEARAKGTPGIAADLAVSRAAVTWNESGRLPPIEEIAQVAFRSAVARNYEALEGLLGDETGEFISLLCDKASSTRSEIRGKGKDAHQVLVSLGALPVHGPRSAIARLLSGADKALLVEAISGLDVEGDLKSVSVFGQVIGAFQAHMLSPTTIAQATLAMARHQAGQVSALDDAFLGLGSTRLPPDKDDGAIGLLVLYRVVSQIATDEALATGLTVTLDDGDDEGRVDWHETLIEPLGHLGLEFGSPAPIAGALDELGKIELQCKLESAKSLASVSGFAASIHLHLDGPMLHAVLEYPGKNVGPATTLATDWAMEFAEGLAPGVWHDSLDSMPKQLEPVSG